MDASRAVRRLRLSARPGGRRDPAGRPHRRGRRRLTGIRLIERTHGPKPVSLTEAGALLLGHARDILTTIDAAKTDIDGADGEPGEGVRVGLYPGVPTRILAATLAAFVKRYPGARISATETVSDAPLLDLVRKARVDVAFVPFPVEPGPFAGVELLRVPYVLVVPAGAEIVQSASPPTVEQIARLPLIALESPRMQPRLRAAAEPRIVFRCEAAHTAQALAGAGVGATILPRLAVDENDPRVAVIELGEEVQPSIVGLVWLRDHTPANGTAEFRELVRHVCATLEPCAEQRVDFRV